MKTLVIAPSWIGDMVMAQSLYSVLKQQHPDGQLHVMAPKWCLPLLSRMPEIDRAIEMPLGHGDFKLSERYRLGKLLRSEHYDQAYILPNSLKSTLIPWFARIPIRTGWKGESRYGLLNDLRNNRKAFPLMVQRYVALAYPKQQMQSAADLTNYPYPKLQVDTQNQPRAQRNFGLDTQSPILGLCPGAEFGPAKRWPAEHYAEVAKQQIEQGWQVWLFGSGKDRETCQQIIEYLPRDLHNNAINLAGETKLLDAIDILALCSCVVSNDSGLMHIAAAVGTPLVALYGSTSPGYTPPLTEKVAILHTEIECRPCFQRECPKMHLKCLTDLLPSQVSLEISKVKKN